MHWYTNPTCDTKSSLLDDLLYNAGGNKYIFPL